MDKSSEDDELVKLLDVKDIEFIEASELIESFENDQFDNVNGNGDSKSNGIIPACTERRSDEPTELSFEKGDINHCTT